MQYKFPRRKRTFHVFSLLQALGSPFYFGICFAIVILVILLDSTISHTASRGTRATISPQYTWRRYAFVTILFFASVSTASGVFYMYIFKDLPSPTQISHTKSQLSTKIYDRHGELLYKIYKDENRSLVQLSQLPPHVIQATLAIEDASFYTHPGFSIKGILRALKTNITKGTSHGGSTITQQLVKNMLLSSEKKIRRKVREIFLAITVDALYPKETILEMYFNQIGYGGSTYGIEEAAMKYFGKSAAQLSIAEAALLAGIPASPTTYSPFGSNPGLAIVRQHEVLRRMAEEHFITPEQAAEAMATPLTYRNNMIDIQAPHFVMYIRSLLAQRYGEELVTQGGLEVYTTLDATVQNQAQTIVQKEIAAIQKYHISNGAALVTNPKTGEVLAMVGSVDYFDLEHDGQVNITTSLRQPGSSIKPITYALALENGMQPSSSIDDAPVVYTIPGSKPYAPKNYDGKFHGKVTLTQALANSYNIPAVKLLSTLGLQKFIDKAEAMGISSWQDRTRFGLSLTLGGGEVYMTDMNMVYGSFATGGETVTLNPLMLIKDAKGKVLYQNTCVTTPDSCPKKRSLSALVAYQITQMLSDNQARSAAFGLNSTLHIPKHQVAVKTGTTNARRDNWTIGYTSDRVVSVWVGNNDNSPMSYVASGITGASPIWNAVMRTQLSDDSPHTFAVPENLRRVAICVTTGTLPCQGCPNITEQYFIAGQEPQTRCHPNQFRANTPAL